MDNTATSHEYLDYLGYLLHRYVSTSLSSVHDGDDRLAVHIESPFAYWAA